MTNTPHTASHLLHLQPEVADALAAGQAVVALESTIISHGMPYPRNIETALRVEKAVREAGAVPATIALLDGRMRAGLTPDEIERLGQTGAGVTKVSRRDMAVLLSRKQAGATTVAATMLVARLAGIRIFATGGIGGVHRGGTHTMDISADLEELARTPVAVVTAGAKAILDLPLTLEYLETRGVPVLGFKTDDFPAFYTRKSGAAVDYRLDEVSEMARVLATHWQLGLGGVVVANPIPSAYEMPAEEIEHAIQEALKLAQLQDIRGKEVTPFLLSRLEALTQGSSLEANIELILNNARLGGALAKALANLAPEGF